MPARAARPTRRPYVQYRRELASSQQPAGFSLAGYAFQRSAAAQARDESGQGLTAVLRFLDYWAVHMTTRSLVRWVAETEDPPPWTKSRTSRRLVRRMLGWHPRMTFDKHGIVLVYNDSQAAALTITWPEVREVRIGVMKRPLFGQDLFLWIVGAGTRVFVILYEDAPADVLVRLRRLPGFNSDHAAHVIRQLQQPRRRSVEVLLWPRDRASKHQGAIRRKNRR